MQDCGSFPCTAPLNLLYKFYNTVYIGGTVTRRPAFQIIADNPGFSALPQL